MKLKKITSEKTAELFNILTGLWPKKCSKLKNACTKNKIWRDDRKRPSNRHHITQNSNLDIFFLSPFRFEVGSWRLVSGGWRLVVGGWRLKVGG